MTSWIIAALGGAAIAAVSYLGVGAAGLEGRLSPARLAGLRAFAAAVAVALFLDAPLAPARPLNPWVALDASASWAPDVEAAPWRAALATADSANRAGADSLLLFGATLRGGPPPVEPTDGVSQIAPLVERARALGRPIVVVTDGALEDPERLTDLPQGSQVIVHALPPRVDLAIAALAVPVGSVIGDTLDVRIVLRAGELDVPARTLEVRLGGRPFGTVAIESLPAQGEREIRIRGVVSVLEGDQPLVAALNPEDVQPRNDSAFANVRVSGTASVAMVSTSPDQDARFALAVLRRTQRGAVRAYWRVAPGQWREGDALRPVTEDHVRRALEQASLVLLHGDTTYFGPPRSRARRALVLMAPPDGSDEHYATSAGDSPLRAALGDLPWEDLPPLRAGLPPRAGTLQALLAMRARRTDERAVVSLRDGPARTVVVSASGFWRWRTRGGRSADAFDAVWGSIFDWVVAADSVRDGATPGARVATELLPRPAAVASGPVGTGPARDLAPRARGAWWLAALALLALCVEWMVRRRLGWR